VCAGRIIDAPVLNEGRLRGIDLEPLRRRPRGAWEGKVGGVRAPDRAGAQHAVDQPAVAAIDVGGGAGLWREVALAQPASCPGIAETHEGAVAGSEYLAADRSRDLADAYARAA